MDILWIVLQRVRFFEWRALLWLHTTHGVIFFGKQFSAHAVPIWGETQSQFKWSRKVPLA